tara:strand:+ start:242 stop:859 length:618 start_codon:yes stop_codon:yes gene_type:complete
MADVMKHVGKVGEKPVVVVYREVPNEPDNALVVETGSLEPEQHDALMNVVQSPEAQESNNISEVLHRRTFPDGSNMLTALHYAKKIVKTPVNLVSLTPTPAQAVSLEDVNAEIRKIENQSNPPLNTEVDPATLVETDPTLAAQQSEPVSSDDPVEVAKGMLQQAMLMEEDVKALQSDINVKKAEAYKLAPELEPKKGPGRPKKLV